jgi:YVTN family beta-propeller protein
LKFAILGTVEARSAGREIPLGGPKQRAVLAILLLAANEPVSRDRLIDGVWGESPPRSAGHTLEDYISRLRRALGGDRIERRPPGYLIRTAPGELDLERFEALLEKGRSEAARGRATEARDCLREALGLWRGRALADLEFEPFAADEVERLEDRRLLAVEGAVEAELELGGGPALIGELERLVGDHPFRERLVAQLMVCLYRAGRQADALATYPAHRHRLAADLGLEPSSELRKLERRILVHDPGLEGAPKARRVARHTHRRRWLVGIALTTALVAGGISAGLKHGADQPSSALGMPGASARFLEVDPTSSTVVTDAALVDNPVAMAVAGESVWLAEPSAGEVVRVDRGAGRVIEQIAVRGSPGALAVGGGSVWVAGVPGDTVTRIDPIAEKVTQTISLGGARAAALAFGLGKLWIADPTDGALLAIDPASGDVVRTYEVDAHPTSLAVGRGGVWIADYATGRVTELAPRSGQLIATVQVGDGPSALALGDNSVWVANSLDSTVSRLDPARDAIVATIPVGSYPVALATSGRFVAVANEYSSSLSRIDVRRDTVVQTIPLDGGPTVLVSAAGRELVGTRALGGHRGGTLVLLHSRPLPPHDLEFQLDLPPFQSNGLTNDTLVTYARADGPQALQLVPDLAVNVPTSTDGGTLYSFRLRPGIRYSTGELVRASDFRRAFERIFLLRAPVADNFGSILGASSCSSRHCNLDEGIVTNDVTGTVTFHLRAANPEFLENLGAIATAPVPAGFPFRDRKALVPGTGPYVVASANAHEIRYVRNRRFREWSHAAQPAGSPDQIVMRYGLSPTQEVLAVEHGKADWTADGVPGSLIRQVQTHFAAQAHLLLTTETDFLQLNTTISPFNELRVRQALNLAVNRAAVVRMYGGPEAATPTCQVLPPGILGYHAFCPYTLRPTSGGRWHAADLARARSLVAGSGTRGEEVTVWGASDGGVLGTTVVRYTARVLRQLGYRARVRLINSSALYGAPPGRLREMQILPAGWLGFSPYEFFGDLLTCSAPLDRSWFCAPKLDRSIRQADALESTDTRAAGELWTRIDREYVDQAVWVPLVNPHMIDFVSARVRNYQADPSLGLIADQVWLR